MKKLIEFKNVTKEYKIGEVTIKAQVKSGMIESVTVNQEKQSVEGIEW